MFDLATNPADAPGVDTQQPTDQAIEQSDDQDLGLQDGQADDANPQDGDDEQPKPELDLEEVEHDGKKYRIPKDLKPALMRQDDYTRKTQELAHARRALEASHQQAIEQATQIQQARIQSHAQLHAIDSELGQLNGLNWLNLRDTQPYVAEYLWNRRQELLAARPTASQQVEQVERLTAQQRDQLAEQGKQTALQRRMEAADRAAREIPGWNEELANAVSNTVMKAYGITAEELQTVADSRFYRILHDAHQFHILKTRSAEALKQKPPVAVTKPVAAVATGKSRQETDPSKMPMDKFAQWFQSRQKRE